MRERSQRFDPRQTMQKNTFEIFHYREPRMNPVEVHHHSFYEVYYLLEGNVEYWVEGRVVSLVPGDLLLISPMELHRPVLTRGQVYERMVLWIHKDYLQSLGGEGFLPGESFDSPRHIQHIRPTASERTALTARFGELVREAYGTEPGAALCAQGIFLQLLVQLCRLVSRSQGAGEQAESRSTRIQRVLEYIHEDPARPMTLEQLAGMFFVSKYHLAHAFSREVGVSLYRYITMRRLILAQQLLSQGYSAAATGRLCGFSDYTGFYRAFCSEYGISPKHWKMQR